MTPLQRHVRSLLLDTAATVAEIREHAGDPSDPTTLRAALLDLRHRGAIEPFNRAAGGQCMYRWVGE